MKKSTIALIGASGGLALSLLKLIEANFHIGVENNVMMIGLLTYLSYIVLGVLVSVFFTDVEEDKKKVRKNAFIMGLLAPSLLIAIVKKEAPADLPIDSIVPEENIELRNLDNIRFDGYSSAEYDIHFMQSLETVKVSKTLTLGDVTPSTQDKINTIIQGQNRTPNKYLYVLGYSDSQEKATSLAKLIDETFFKMDELVTPVKTSVYSLPNERYIISIGEIHDRYDIMSISEYAKRQAKRGQAQGNADPDRIKLLSSIIMNGEIVNGMDLWESESIKPKYPFPCNINSCLSWKFSQKELDVDQVYDQYTMYRADVNKDGKNDLIFQGGHAFFVHLGTDECCVSFDRIEHQRLYNGQFVEGLYQGYSFALEDLDEDEILDIVYNRPGGGAFYYPGYGDGSFDLNRRQFGEFSN